MNTEIKSAGEKAETFFYDLRIEGILPPFDAVSKRKFIEKLAAQFTPAIVGARWVKASEIPNGSGFYCMRHRFVDSDKEIWTSYEGKWFRNGKWDCIGNLNEWEWLESAQPMKGAWIKASERLPDKTHNYFVRASKKHQGYNHNDTAFFRVENKSWEFKDCSSCYVVEWLDESHEQPIKSVANDNLWDEVEKEIMAMYKSEAPSEIIAELKKHFTIHLKEQPIKSVPMEIELAINEAIDQLTNGVAHPLVVKNKLITFFKQYLQQLKEK